VPSRSDAVYSRKSAPLQTGRLVTLEVRIATVEEEAVACPAEYRSSGVMTFIVNQSGAVFEKDLGPNTETIATTMTDYNPDCT